MEQSTRSSRVVRFGVYELDLLSGELHKQGLKVKLQEQPFQVLAKLLEHPGRVVTREELRQRTEELKRRADELQKIANDLSQQAQVKGRELVDEAKRQWDKSGVGQRPAETGARSGEGGHSAKS